MYRLDPGVQPGRTVKKGLRFFIRTGRRIAYEEFGAEGGFPLLYLHHPGGSRLEAQALDASASVYGFRVIAMDRPGLGRSDPVLSRALDPVGDLAALASGLRLPYYGLLAWGGGTGHALELAARETARVRFVLSMSCPFLMTDTCLEGNGGPAHEFVRRLLRQVTQWRCRLSAMCAAPSSSLHCLERIVAPVDRRMLQDPSVRDWLQGSLDEGARQGGRAVARDVACHFRNWTVNPALSLPVEFWYGAADRSMSDAGGRWLARRLRSARLRRVSGAGHFFFLRHQQILFEGLRGLASTRGPLRAGRWSGNGAWSGPTAVDAASEPIPRSGVSAR